ncbi:MAG: carboxypeptidase regulatory-like domain-containing protein [Bacteroidetes bacterium]|nr:carboxypeptidase regulatory-like domain-containing protein [Bacteroidota bacterium]
MENRMKTTLICLAAGLFIGVQDASAYRLEVVGLVTDYATLQAMPAARVRIYKNGALQTVRFTNGAGGYSIKLDNHADYVVRVDAPGYQVKCITVDTKGMEWEGDNRVSKVEVEVRLPRLGSGVDLSYFDLPVGMARFEPATGLTRWNVAYEGRVNEEARLLMDHYEKRCRELGFPLPARSMDLGAVLVRGTIDHGGL